MKDYDFSGWATRNDILCSDGRVIKKNAFKHNHGTKVPLVWNHQHDNPEEILGHAYLENREEGVYTYGKFNETESGKIAKLLVENGDIDKLSIYANKLKSDKQNVLHGQIREVSLVLAGANPGAYIDTVITHGDGDDMEEEAIIYTEEKITNEPVNDTKDENSKPVENTEENKVQPINQNDEIQHNKETSMGEETIDVKAIFDTLTEEQKNAVYAIVGQVSEDIQEEIEGENMKHNIFESDYEEDDFMIHSEILSNAIKDAKKHGSLRDSIIEHAAVNNITDINKLFPNATELYNEPYMIENNNDWVAKVMGGVKHTPFSRVKTTFGRMNETEARAKGYIKGTEKTDIKLSIINRVTTPTTVYVKNTIDRDDIIDITDFSVVAWQKKEMRKALDKELALAILLGDGRQLSDPNKINEQNIRPIIKDEDLYTIKYTVKNGRDYVAEKESDSLAKGIIRSANKARKNYKGSGKPTFFTTEGLLTELLLIEDLNGRLIYDSEEKLATALRVKEIVTLAEMEKFENVYGIIVNLQDYTAGADKGGSINMFEDFDIDYNQEKTLIETRMSGALTVPYSAIVLKKTDEALG